MTVRRSLVLALLALAVAAGGWWFTQNRDKAPGPAGPRSGAPETPSPTPLEFAATDLLEVRPGAVSRSIPITGSLRPARQTLVRAKVAGDLRELPVREGMTVREGQVIARIDVTEFEWRVKDREAQLRAAQAQVENAQRTLANNRQLFEKGFISQSALDAAQSGADVAVGNRDAAMAQLAMARKSLADTAVTAPLSGTVAERFAQPGEKVSPDTRILSIVDLSQMEIEAAVPASEIGHVAVGQKVTLGVEGVEAPQAGRIVRINPGTTAGTRSIAIYIGLANPDARLRAGLFAQGSLALETRADALTVPAAALREAAGRTFVYAIESDRLVEKPVVTGLRDDTATAANGSAGVIEIREGLKAGDRIVAVNLGPLRVGAPARQRTAPAAAR